MNNKERAKIFRFFQTFLYYFQTFHINFRTFLYIFPNFSQFFSLFQPFSNAFFLTILPKPYNLTPPPTFLPQKSISHQNNSKKSPHFLIIPIFFKTELFTCRRRNNFSIIAKLRAGVLTPLFLPPTSAHFFITQYALRRAIVNKFDNFVGK
jgi:Mg2+ and Co2+ transporter CorA